MPLPAVNQHMLHENSDEITQIEPEHSASSTTSPKNVTGAATSRYSSEDSGINGRIPLKDVEQQSWSSTASLDSAEWPADSVMGTIVMDGLGKDSRVPILSKDPRDPLALSRKRRWCIVIIFSYFISTVFSIQSAISDTRSSGFNQKSSSLDVFEWLPPVFTFISALTFIPISRRIGRKPVFLVSGVSLLAALCVYGLATGALVSITPLVIQDVTFLHERNRAFGALFVLRGIFTMAIGIIAQIASGNSRWRGFFYILLAPQGLGFLLVLLAVPETVFARRAGDIVGLPSTDLQESKSTESDEQGSRSLNGKGSLTNETKTMGVWLWLLRFLKLMILPHIVWLIFLLTILLMTMDASSTSLTSINSEQRYMSLPPARIYSMFALVGGILWSYFTSGIGGDYLSSLLARRNGRVRQAEYQLVNFILPLLCGIVGNVLLGATLDGLPLIDILPALYCGAIFSGITSSLEYNALVYAIEAYPTSAGAVAAILNTLPRLISGQLSVSLSRLTDEWGPARVSGLLAGLFTFIGLFIIPAWIWGKAMRRRWDMRPEYPDLKVYAT